MPKDPEWLTEFVREERNGFAKLMEEDIIPLEALDEALGHAVDLGTVHRVKPGGLVPRHAHFHIPTRYIIWRFFITTDQLAYHVTLTAGQVIAAVGHDVSIQIRCVSEKIHKT